MSPTDSAALVAEARKRILSRKGESAEAVDLRVRKDMEEGWYGLSELSFESLVAMLVTALAEATAAERERCARIFSAAIENGYEGPSGTEKCAHGARRWDDCIACYGEALMTAVAAIRKEPTDAG